MLARARARPWTDTTTQTECPRQLLFECAEVKFKLVRVDVDCMSQHGATRLGHFISNAEKCARKCEHEPGCEFFTVGKGPNTGECWYVHTTSASCPKQGWSFFVQKSFLRTEYNMETLNTYSFQRCKLYLFKVPSRFQRLSELLTTSVRKNKIHPRSERLGKGPV